MSNAPVGPQTEESDSLSLGRTTVSERSDHHVSVRTGDDDGVYRFQQIHDLIYLVRTNCSFKGAAVEQITLNPSESVSSTGPTPPS